MTFIWVLSARLKFTVSPSLSETGMSKAQLPPAGQRTIGGTLLTGELSGEAKLTTVLTR